MLPDLIAPKAFPIPVKIFSFTPKILDAKTNPAAIPFGFDLSSIKDKASAINCWLFGVFWPAASINETNPRP